MAKPKHESEAEKEILSKLKKAKKLGCPDIFVRSGELVELLNEVYQLGQQSEREKVKGSMAKESEARE